MIENKTLIFGATRGIGKVVTKHLKKNGHKIIQFSRNKSKKNHNIQIDLSNLNEISETLNQSLSKKEKIKNIIFSQRYRGDKRPQYVLAVAVDHKRGADDWGTMGCINQPG